MCIETQLSGGLSQLQRGPQLLSWLRMKSQELYFFSLQLGKSCSVYIELKQETKCTSSVS